MDFYLTKVLSIFQDKTHKKSHANLDIIRTINWEKFGSTESSLRKRSYQEIS